MCPMQTLEDRRAGSGRDAQQDRPPELCKRQRCKERLGHATAPEEDTEVSLCRTVQGHRDTWRPAPGLTRSIQFYTAEGRRIPPSCLARTAALRPLPARARPRSVPFPAGGSAQLAPDAASGRPCFRPYAASIPAARSRERRGRGSRAARVTRERSLDVRVVQCVARATRGRDLAGCRR